MSYLSVILGTWVFKYGIIKQLLNNLYKLPQDVKNKCNKL